MPVPQDCPKHTQKAESQTTIVDRTRFAQLIIELAKR